MSRAPRSLQGGHVDSSQVAEVVAVSVAVLAVVVVVVEAGRVAGRCLLLERCQSGTFAVRNRFHRVGQRQQAA